MEKIEGWDKEDDRLAEKKKHLRFLQYLTGTENFLSHSGEHRGANHH